MKHRNSIFCLLPALLLSLISCSEKIDKEKLDKLADIEAMGDSCPERAIIRLDSIRPQFGNENEYMRNKLAMLDIRLHDKAFITHTSDSTIKEVCSYFEKHGTAKEMQEAYYYMGSVYRDMNDYPNAVTYYLKAIEIAENNKDIDYAIMEVSYTQLADIFHKQHHYTESLNAMLKGVEIADKHGFANERTYMSLSNAYKKINDTSNTILFCNKAMDIIEKDGINKRNADVVAKAMSLYVGLDHIYDATRCYNMLNQLKEDEKPHNYLATLGAYYEKCVSKDSAAVIARKIFDSTEDITELYYVSKWLTCYYSDKGDYENATKYAIYFIRVNNTIIMNRDIENTDNAKNYFQYQRNKEEESAIMNNAANHKLWLTISILLSLTTIVLLSTIHIKKRKRLFNIILKSDGQIRELKQKVQKMEEEQVQLTLKNTELLKGISYAEAESNKLVEQNCELTKHVIMSRISENAEDIIIKIKETSKGQHHLSDEEWKELLGAIDKQFPDFTHEVQAKFKKISTPMLRVCYLWKIKCSNPEISNITGYPPQTVWDRVKRIEKVLGSTKGQ